MDGRGVFRPESLCGERERARNKAEPFHLRYVHTYTFDLAAQSVSLNPVFL